MVEVMSTILEALSTAVSRRLAVGRAKVPDVKRRELPTVGTDGSPSAATVTKVGERASARILFGERLPPRSFEGR
jgi:hypothetical protein